MSILDAGCGDGEFLAQVLRGRPSLIRLEDLVGENVRRASARLQHAAAEISAATTDVRVCSDLRRYDVVVAIGLFDYDKDWNTLLRHLLDRAAGMVIADFPKHSTLHSFMRRYWLRVQGVHFESTDRSRLENWLRNCGHETTIAELPLQWMARISS
jgi:cyclopropane fatty-acyl-phospholipid synthase-like methyltransferase